MTYDPAARKWTSLGTLPAGMAETHLGATTDGQYMYFAGGFGGDLNLSASPSQWVSDKVWRYDPAIQRASHFLKTEPANDPLSTL